MKTALTAQDIIRILRLRPHPVEGGFFSETFRTSRDISLPLYSGARPLSTAIYYLLAPGTFSQMHRLPGDEMFHFYLGDPVEMLQLSPEGKGEIVPLGQEIHEGMKPQHNVPGGYWQGASLKNGGRFALMGTTMSPGFDYADYESGKREELIRLYPDWQERIAKLCRE